MDRTEEYLKVARAAMRFIDTRKMKGPAGIFWSLEDAAAGRSIYYDEISMYAGASGILCFLLSLHQATGSEAYLKEAEEAGSYLIWRWKNQRELKRNFSPYAFSSGWSGAGFASLLLYEETGRERYAELAEGIVTQICRDARKSADGAGNYWSDYPGIVGDAGTVLFLLCAAETMQRESWKRFAVEAGRIYLNKGRNMGEGRRCYDGVNPVYFGAGLDYVDPNFPMGTAGIGYTLLKLYEASREECFLEAVSGIPEYLSHIAVRIRKGRLLPHGLPDRPDLFYLGYCHGPAGTCRFYYELSKFKDPAECRKMIDSLVKGVQDMGAPELRSEGYWNNYNICCGTAGILNLYLGLWAAYRDESFLEQARRCGEVILKGAINENAGGEEQVKWRYALDRIAPDNLSTPVGFFDGAAGIGAGLLQLYLAEQGKFHAVRMIDDPFPSE